MAYAADLPPVMAGEVEFLSVSFAPRLGSGETISTAQAGVQLWQASPVVDPHAAALLIGVPFISGISVVAVVGGAYAAGVSGFQPGAVYSVWFSATTSLGQTLEIAANVAVQPFAPPSFSSGGPLPSSEYSETTNFTPSVPGTFYLNASGLTLTIPATNVGGDILVIDLTGAPNLTISGSLLNGLPVMGPDGTFTLRWSSKYSGYFWR